MDFKKYKENCNNNVNNDNYKDKNSKYNDEYNNNNANDNAEKFINDRKNSSEKELFDELLLNISKQKKQGNFDEKQLIAMKNQLNPILNNEQRQKLDFYIKELLKK